MKKKVLLSFPPPAGSMDRYSDLYDITAPDHDLHYEEVYDVIADYDIFYTCHVTIDEALMKKGLEGKTRIIGNFGVGYDHMDVAADLAVRLGIFPKKDSSTGYAQIFGYVGMNAANFAVDQGLSTYESLGIETDHRLDPANEDDVRLVWKLLKKVLPAANA